MFRNNFDFTIISTYQSFSLLWKQKSCNVSTE